MENLKETEIPGRTERHKFLLKIQRLQKILLKKSVTTSCQQRNHTGSFHPAVIGTCNRPLATFGKLTKRVWLFRWFVHSIGDWILHRKVYHRSVFNRKNFVEDPFWRWNILLKVCFRVVKFCEGSFNRPSFICEQTLGNTLFSVISVLSQASSMRFWNMTDIDCHQMKSFFHHIIIYDIILFNLTTLFLFHCIKWTYSRLIVIMAVKVWIRKKKTK